MRITRPATPPSILPLRLLPGLLALLLGICLNGSVEAAAREWNVFHLRVTQSVGDRFEDLNMVIYHSGKAVVTDLAKLRMIYDVETRESKLLVHDQNLLFVQSPDAFVYSQKEVAYFYAKYPLPFDHNASVPLNEDLFKLEGPMEKINGFSCYKKVSNKGKLPQFYGAGEFNFTLWLSKDAKPFAEYELTRFDILGEELPWHKEIVSRLKKLGVGVVREEIVRRTRVGISHRTTTLVSVEKTSKVPADLLEVPARYRSFDSVREARDTMVKEGKIPPPSRPKPSPKEQPPASTPGK